MCHVGILNMYYIVFGKRRLYYNIILICDTVTKMRQVYRNTWEVVACMYNFIIFTDRINILLCLMMPYAFRTFTNVNDPCKCYLTLFAVPGACRNRLIYYIIRWGILKHTGLNVIFKTI